jgi:hypothetical protein
LRTQLLIEIKDKKILSSEYVTVGGQPAIRTLLEGDVQGEKVRIESYTFTRDGLVYDIVYWAHPHGFEFYYKDFQQVVESLRFIEPTA